ncbi:uncharacterized protein LOC106180958 [Lingula anatina]|uniref:Uncharacterized protein LOC106180958 n=1 Tax=Lingula anatina TaxID=7574 RepID=A0A1S3KDM6_LINAN|nr:uncharacterized protein LOC106180958 [Lingula anatina]|eukprot:XP_013420597.1 uncharacterized protein LOC106180958 [Lingula anatina]
MTRMVWDDDLANCDAQAYANRCIWAHGTVDLTGCPYDFSTPQYRGQNLWARTAFSAQKPTNLATNVVDSLHAENQYYNYASNTCNDGKVCGHYTQLVWANSYRLGCGIAYCTTGSPFAQSQNWWNVVCHYFPGGNYQGQKPYKSGQGCSQCPSGSGGCSNDGKLCISSYECTMNPSACGGYGHIAPRTMWGKLVCIAYAVLGIPLTLLFLTNIGDVMADIFRYIYAKVCCCGCIRKKNKDKVQEIRTPSPTKGWKLDETGKPLPPSREPTIIDNDDDDDDEEEEKITVPLTVTMLVIIGWLLGGSVLYTVWYKDWKWYSSFYFCFITMSTIGFGDYYPSVDNGLGTVEDIMIMVSAWTYTIVGMAFLAMGFNLMQDEIVDKFKWIGEKLGFYKKEEEEGEEAEE